MPRSSSRPDPVEGADFDSFWMTYPRRVGKATATKAYEKAIKKIDPAELQEAVEGFAAEWRRRPQRDHQYIPHPTTWLNQERWADVSVASASPSNAVASGVDFRTLFSQRLGLAG